MQALIYEYEQDLEDLLGYLLSKENFVFKVAKVLDDLHRLAATSSPDLILLGTCPPYKSQLEIALNVKESFPGSYLLVLSTDRNTYRQIQQMEDASFSCLETPFPPKVLKSTLHHIREQLELAGK